MNQWFRLAQSAGWCYTFKNMVFVCEKPNALHVNPSGQLHKDGAMALEYSDGYGLYMLNGVNVPDWLVLQKDTDIDPSRITEFTNADVRREFVRKVGYDRLYYKLGGKTLDKKEIAISNGCMMFTHRYEVIELNVGNDRKWTVLKMTNPSLSTPENEVYHIEGLPNNCNTVDKAIQFRKPEKMKLIPIDDVHGQDYYQHGDRVIWPVGAKSLKHLPKILT
jgi:hypothetical protein